MTSEYIQALYDLRDALKLLERELGSAADTCERVARKGGTHERRGNLGNSGNSSGGDIHITHSNN